LYADVESSSIGSISINYELGIHEYIGIFVQADIANAKSTMCENCLEKRDIKD